MHNPSQHIQAKGYGSILDSIAKGISLVSTIFRLLVHPIPTSLFIQLNDFLHLSNYNQAIHIYCTSYLAVLY